MNKTYTRIVWENQPSINTPINATNLNKMDNALDVIDNRVVGLDTEKAAQTDLLSVLKNVTYNTTNGKFLFTWVNGTTKEFDLNVEKIPVDFSMSDTGVITMKTADGTRFTADISTLIKNYAFVDSSTIDFTLTKEQDGSTKVVADIIEGSVTENKLQPNFLADVRTASNTAQTAAGSASTNSLIAEGYALGKQNGEPVDETSQYYHNNGEYYYNETFSAYARTQSAARSAETAEGNARQSEINTKTSEGVVASIAVQATQTAMQIESTAARVATDASTASSSATTASEAATTATNKAAEADAQKLVSEGYAVGTQNGNPVGSSSPYYHNNAKYYSEKAVETVNGKATKEELYSCIVKGTYNLINYPYVGKSGFLNGITFTVNEDGSIKVNGTASTNTSLILMQNVNLENNVNYSSVSNCSVEETNTLCFQVYASDWSTVSWFQTSRTFKALSSKVYMARIYVGAGAIVNNVIFKPMLVKTNSDGTYPTNYIRGSILSNYELMNSKVDKVDGKGLSTNDYTDTDKSDLANALQTLAAYGVNAAPFLINGKWDYEEVSGNTDGSGWLNLSTDNNKYSFIIACPLIAGFQCKVTKSSARWVIRCVDAITTTLSGTSYSVDVGTKNKAVKIGLLKFLPATATQNFDE